MRRIIHTVAVLLTLVGLTSAIGLPVPIRPLPVMAVTEGTSGVLALHPTAASQTAPFRQVGLRRLVIEGESSLPLRADSGGGFIVYTEAGSWTFMLAEGASRVNRITAANDMSNLPGPLIANSALGYGSLFETASATDDLAIGSEVTLTAGDVLWVDGWGEASLNGDATSASLVIVEIVATSTPPQS